MRARDGKFGVKTRPQNRQKLENILGKLRFSFSKTPIFLAQNLIFFNGSTAFRFPRNPRKSSSTAFQFLQRLSDFRPQIFLAQNLIFFNGFPISKNLQRLSAFFYIVKNTHILNILTFRSELRNSCVKIFRH